MPLFHFRVTLFMKSFQPVYENGCQCYQPSQQTPSLILIVPKKVELFGLYRLFVRIIWQIIMMSCFQSSLFLSDVHHKDRDAVQGCLQPFKYDFILLSFLLLYCRSRDAQPIFPNLQTRIPPRQTLYNFQYKSHINSPIVDKCISNQSVNQYPQSIKTILYLLSILSMSTHQTIRGKRPQTTQQKRKETPFELTSDESREFAEDEVVWAKVVGHPWWPAVIAEKSYPLYSFDEEKNRLKRREVTYRVSFFGESSHAFLDQSKIAEYLPHRDYFVEMAFKQSKRCNIENFKASVRQADIISNNPFEVGDVTKIAQSPKKERQNLEQENTDFRAQKVEKSQEKQKSIFRSIKNESKVEKKKPSLSFQMTLSQKNLSQHLLKQLKFKNQGKYCTKTLKCAVVRALRRENLLRNIDQNHSQDVLKWINKISTMNIGEIVRTYCKKSEISLMQNKTPLPPQDKQTPKLSFDSNIPLTYIYIDELGNQSTISEPLKPYDFYIEL